MSESKPQRPSQRRNLTRSFISHVTAIIMSTVYDYDISGKDDSFIKAAEIAMGRLGNATFAGAALVNIFPFLRYLPEWCPGSGFKAFARDTKVYTDAIVNGPLELVKKRMVRP